MKKYIILFFKGMAMGIANVIPGVSGGTIALITEVYEELINSLKSFDKSALKMIIALEFSKFIIHTKRLISNSKPKPMIFFASYMRRISKINKAFIVITIS